MKTRKRDAIHVPTLRWCAKQLQTEAKELREMCDKANCDNDESAEALDHQANAIERMRAKILKAATLNLTDTEIAVSYGQILTERVDKAIEVAICHGQTDGAHHKTWVIDQMLRILAGDRYAAIVTVHNAGEEGPNTYEWNTGIAP